MKVKSLAATLAAGIAAVSLSSAAFAAPAAPAPSAAVALSDTQLDGVNAGWGFTSICSGGINCNGNGGSYNGNTVGLVNILNGNYAGAAVQSGNTLLLFR